jgi:hypothetical protein
MKLSHLSSKPYRAHVIRMSRRKVRSIVRINNIDPRPALITKLSHVSLAPHRTHITAIDQRYPSLILRDRTSEPQRDLRLIPRGKNLKTRTGAVRKVSRKLSTSSGPRITPINKRESNSIDQAKSIDSQTTPVSLFLSMKSVNLNFYYRNLIVLYFVFLSMVPSDEIDVDLDLETSIHCIPTTRSDVRTQTRSEVRV